MVLYITVTGFFTNLSNLQVKLKTYIINQDRLVQQHMRPSPNTMLWKTGLFIWVDFCIFGVKKKRNVSLKPLKTN